MSGFAGFSEADIKNVQNGNHVHKKLNDSQGKVTVFSKHQRKNPKNLKLNCNIRNQKSSILKSVMEEIPIEAKLDKTETISEPKEIAVTDAQLISEETKHETKDIITHAEETKKSDVQSRQQLIEEQNRRRKELLAKALADRTQKTQEEQQRLDQIRNEFKKLDVHLSNDVQILRKQIEIASLDYMQAQKTYLKKEKEFLDAKLVLHTKLEKKELLTEHLCAIIEQNEEQKAKKLNELLLKLQLNVDDVQNNEVTSTVTTT